MGSVIGVQKIAARRLGISFDEWKTKVAAGEKWCTSCKKWLSRGLFGKDATRGDGLAAHCGSCKAGLRSYEPVLPVLRKGQGPSRKPSRSGDVKQARHHVNLSVAGGRLPPPNNLACVDCGHIALSKGPTDRHEYDHYLGYEAKNHLMVQVVCVPCHRARDRRRRGRLLDGRTWDEMPKVAP